VWRPEETPVAFWAWRDELPRQEAVDKAMRETGARVLFARAGQFDREGGKLPRIRAAKGKWPSGVALHLAYNATPALLRNFEKTDADALAQAVAETFRQDAERARADGANVAGLQLDIDAPTRLLPHYADILRRVRAALPPDAQLSVTGLPTWMESASLRQALEAVDFWTPQCYGAQIPQRLDDARPIASPDEVKRGVARARALGKPFYAGLAAYGYALLYGKDGRLGALRGDFDPARAVADARWEMLERKPFTATDGAATGAYRYVLRAREAGVLDGLAWQAGETLVLDAPSAESLRQTARAARVEGGPQMLGLCVFRLPETDDATSLKLPQIVAALQDTPPAPPQVLTKLTPAHRDPQAKGRAWLLTVTNNGATDALMGDGALAVTLLAPPGQARVSAGDEFQPILYLCGAEPATAQPCSPRRANFLQLNKHAWPAGEEAKIYLNGDTKPEAWQIHLAARFSPDALWRDTRPLISREPPTP
jgi:hypothetical protein